MTHLPAATGLALFLLACSGSPDTPTTPSKDRSGVETTTGSWSGTLAPEVDGEEPVYTWYTDHDGDGWGDEPVEAAERPEGAADIGGDCDDRDGGVHPGADEVCDGVDNDCDGGIDDADADRVGGSTWYEDADGDGYGDPGAAVLACAAPPGAVPVARDCDDVDPSVHPGVDEVCNGVDDDCNGLVDDDDEQVADGTTWYHDFDGDGYGLTGKEIEACLAPSGYVDIGGDCDDYEAAIHPAATEVCDTLDNDCDTLVDDDDPDVDATYFSPDADLDGFGDSSSSEAWCEPPEGYVEDASDCDDDDVDINPLASEVCDGADNDCDTLTDEDDPDLDLDTMETWYADDDSDGYGDADDSEEACLAPSGFVSDDADCDDTDGSIHPFAGDVLGDGVDSDCDELDCEADTYGSTYFVVCQNNVYWSRANWKCTNAGYDGLASIRDSGEQAFVEVLLYDSGGWTTDAPWIGLSDSDEEGTWVWSDGWTGSYTNWSPDEPNSDGDEDCGHLNWRLSWGSWNDADCSFERSWGGFVCQAR